jgi:hypothetical protein
MRRILSLAMLLVFCFPLISPLFASTPESNLPSCCRRDGAHHCMGSATLELHGGTGLSALKQKCPSYPKAIAVVGTGQFFLVPTQAAFAEIAAHPTAQPQTEARYRISFGRSRQKRGPPSLLL